MVSERKGDEEMNDQHFFERRGGNPPIPTDQLSTAAETTEAEYLKRRTIV
jgi:hypothetical protein